MAKRDRRGKLDAYELAILRGGNQTFELSAEGADAATEDGSPPPLRPLKVGRFKVGSLGLLGGFFVIVLLVSISRLGDSGPKGLPANCTSYVLSVPTKAVEEHQPVAWAAAGPDGDVVLAIDAGSLGIDLTPMALPGRTAQVIRPPLRLTGCTATAVFGVQVPVGLHTATLFRLTPDGPVATVSQPLEVRAADGAPAPIGG